jgi:hypothetical protein
MEAIRSSKTSGATQRTTWRHIPEDDTLYLLYSTIQLGFFITSLVFLSFLAVTDFDS